MWCVLEHMQPQAWHKPNAGMYGKEVYMYKNIVSDKVRVAPNVLQLATGLQASLFELKRKLR